MGVIMSTKEVGNIIIGIGVAIFVCTALFFFVNMANAKETTTLDDALERPVVVQKYVDKANNVICYWVEGERQFTFTCIQKRGLRQHNSDAR
jgi:hypothetical protein